MTTWVLFAGAPGSGKSTLATALASRLSAAILDKDRVREALFPGVLTRYTAGQDDLCMRAVLDAASYLTREEAIRFIFLDGRTFSRRAQIDAVLAAAAQAGARWRILHLSCAEEVAIERLTQSGSHPARNRTPALYRRIARAFEPIPYPALALDTTAGIQTQLDAIERYLTSEE